MSTVSLDKLPINKSGKICALSCKDSNIRRRLLDLGLVNGTNVVPILKSPLGDPIAYSVRGSTIALRKDDSRFISIDY